MPTDQKRWGVPVSKKEKLTKEDAKFIFEQAEKQLKTTIEIADTIVNRTNILLTVIISLIIGLTAYIIKKWSESYVFDNLTITSCIGDFYLFIVGFLAVRNMHPHPYDTIGSLPKDLIIDTFFVDAVPKEDRIIRFYISEAENYQFRVERNSATNNKRWKMYKQSLWVFLITPIIFIISYLIVFWFTRP